MRRVPVKQARILLLLGCLLLAVPAISADTHGAIFDYIQRTWDTLTRSHRNLGAAAEDPKFGPLPDGRWPVYISPHENLDRITRQLRGEMPAADFDKIAIRVLLSSQTPPAEPGLLYLPRPYVVPGGRFNEMYGWDSFFIQMGLLRDGRLDLAKDMADNFLYEIREYGKILNANRSYYLTRSQPPFLTEMLLAVYRRTHDRQWLAGAIPEIEKYYEYWTVEPHLTPENGLSRYFDLGHGPAPEVIASELDSQGRNDYQRVLAFYRGHRITAYDLSEYYDRSRDRLTERFYQGDRSMRESGFDPSSRFGPFSVAIADYDPVCLNSLLYRMEIETGEILDAVGRGDEATAWRKRAEDRASRINRLLWDARDGLYYDYDFVHRRIRRYPFLTTFYPLWTGIASAEQAARVEQSLSRFEKSAGLETSTFRSGDQWDAPFGWAPVEWIAVQGLRRYGYSADANRISEHFLALLQRGFARSGTLVEKYDVVRAGTDVSKRIRFGYSTNEAGFGWTNAVFTSLFDELPGKRKEELRRPWSAAQ